MDLKYYLLYGSKNNPLKTIEDDHEISTYYEDGKLHKSIESNGKKYKTVYDVSSPTLDVCDFIVEEKVDEHTNRSSYFSSFFMFRNNRPYKIVDTNLTLAKKICSTRYYQGVYKLDSDWANEEAITSSQNYSYHTNSFVSKIEKVSTITNKGIVFEEKETYTFKPGSMTDDDSPIAKADTYMHANVMYDANDKSVKKMNYESYDFNEDSIKNFKPNNNKNKWLGTLFGRKCIMTSGSASMKSHESELGDNN